MENKIKLYLQEIEDQRNIKILLACETGSRAWGFPSPDSDYDVRLIYVHKSDWYISVNNSKDSIDLMLENNDIDISGWELKKSLGLINKSNASLIERIQSPILYSADREFIAEFTNIAQSCYSKIATMHHYLSMCKKMFEAVNDKGQYKLKSFFYALRTSLLCKWIIERREIPPIEFSKVYNSLGLSPKIVNRIDELIKLKSTISESYLHNGEKELFTLIEECIKYADEKKNSLTTGKCNMELLNTHLRKYVSKYDN